MKTAGVWVALVLIIGGIAGLRFQKGEPPSNPPRVVIKPAAAPKTLVERWDEEEAFNQHSAYAFQRPYREPPFQPLAFYVGSESPQNLIAERVSAGRLNWGPKALDTPYAVTWRGQGWITLRVPAVASEDEIERWKAEVRECEPVAEFTIERMQ